MVFTRQNVWELGGDWADPILWYARGVKAMQARALNQPTAWGFFGAIHGFNPSLWKKLGYATTPVASPADDKAYWKQCQHGSWYFLPWHRGYLLAFEAVVRDAIAQLKGPSDWALPYWNYFGPGQNPLPHAFGLPDWPDGKGDNPLYVKARYGPGNNGTVYVPLNQVNLDALGDPDFTGPGGGGGPGFGGIDTGFSHSGRTHGALESQPHDQVHVLVGGSDGNTNMPGLMSVPDTAGLDPIFWLHHANIDRLWEVWRQNPPSHVDPTQANWLKGPAGIGQRAFEMPMPAGKSLTYTPADMSDLSKLGYTYDDLSSPAAAPQPAARLQALGASPAIAAQAIGRVAAMAAPKNVELLGSQDQSLRLVGGEARASVALKPEVQRKVSASLATAAETATPDRVFLNLENVRAANDANVFNVYINVPDGEDPAQHPELRAGSIALFGATSASQADGEHAGDGLTFVLEITKIVDALHLQGALEAGKLDVRLVPLNPVSEASQVSIGRISVFRQGR
jgi:tyrosinase